MSVIPFDGKFFLARSSAATTEFKDLKVNITTNYSFHKKALVIKLHITSNNLGDYTIGIRLFRPSELKKGVFITLLKSLYKS